MSLQLSIGSSVRLLATLGVDLTGQTVSFQFEPSAPAGAADGQGFTLDLSGGAGQTRAATVVDAAAGKVQYILTTADTAQAGVYRGQFAFTSGGVTQVFPPAGWLEWVVQDFVAPSEFSALTDFCEPVRAVMGDFRPPYKYEDGALTSVVRSVVRMGLLPNSGFGITADGLKLTPPLNRPSDLALLTYQSARVLLRPNIGGFSWRSRALSVRKGDQRDFLRELENAIYYLANPTQLTTFQSYYAWVNSLAGINVWGLMSEMKVGGPVATVNLGVSGMTVTST